MIDFEKIRLLSLSEILSHKGSALCICTLNAQHLHLIDSGEMRMGDLSNLVFTLDSRWIKRLLDYYSYKVDSLVTGVQIFNGLLEKSVQENKNIYFLGASEMSNQMARAKYLRENGKRAYGSSPDRHDMDNLQYIENLVQELAELKVDYLILGFGAPFQEIFMSKHREFIQRETTVSIALGCGAAIDFYSGVQRKCPSWINYLGLEIFFRYITDISLKRAQRISQSAIGLMKLRSFLKYGK